MEILWSLLTLPYAPVRGLTAVLKVVAREAEARQRDPVHVRRELEQIEAAAAAGELTAEERDTAEQQVLARLVSPGGPVPEPRPDQPETAGAGAPRRRRKAPVARRREGTGAGNRPRPQGRRTR
ncbi:Gas vesicle protein G [Micromonospora pallida]|uniref:Gas vesicle protein G n=1 Tax=Micromonospora pallida TaxID=145854 RepID=A0A1C6TER6_9ACTN|nr:gas vesicle protein GvpG [Micromonospora pallida]SCL40241.1 Gas vesicle protein G [Micromonospora pallida]